VHTFSHAFTVGAPIDWVWEFYTDACHLEVITPPQLKLKMERSTTGRRLEQGTEVWISGSLVARVRWHSKITRMEPHLYVDEMLEGMFKVWKHTHSFRQAEECTEVIDEIMFELPYGIIGRAFEGYAGGQLKKIFAYRKEATIKALR
jgi:ligand-binding SRPBCC domain-containing protein